MVHNGGDGVVKDGEEDERGCRVVSGKIHKSIIVISQ